eukprot:1857754-Pyramimonas_sp.AAC.1
MGAFWGTLWPSRRPLEPFWGYIGPLWGGIGRLLRPLGRCEDQRSDDATRAHFPKGDGSMRAYWGGPLRVPPRASWGPLGR